MQSWKAVLPDYQYRVWNELTFDIQSSRWVREAYQHRQWAFVSDYVRLWALYHYGGVYLDTDVEVFQSLDAFLEHAVFTGFETPQYIPTGILGAERANPWIKRMLQYYEEKAFVSEDGSLNTMPNVSIITDIATCENNFRATNEYQVLADDIHIYPREFFCVDTGVIAAYTKHHFNGSWLNRKLSAEALAYKKLFSILRIIIESSVDQWIFRLKTLNLEGKTIGFIHHDILIKQLVAKLQKTNTVQLACYLDDEKAGSMEDNLPIIGLANINDQNLDVIVFSVVENPRASRQYIQQYFPGKVLSVEDLTGCYELY